MTYSHMATSHTTIGAERFHFRVRNGIGWFPLAIATRRTVSMGGPTDAGPHTAIRSSSAKHVRRFIEDVFCFDACRVQRCGNLIR